MDTSFGLRSSFGLFVQPMGEVRGWGRDIIGFALAIQNLSWGIIAVLTGGLVGRRLAHVIWQRFMASYF